VLAQQLALRYEDRLLKDSLVRLLLQLLLHRLAATS
jgi:hypothetical protein